MTVRFFYKRDDDGLAHVVEREPAPGRWGAVTCGRLFQWEPGTERRVSRTDDAPSCLACVAGMSCVP